MKDGNHNLKISIKTLSGFEYKPEVKNKSGSKLVVRDENGKILHEGEFKSFTANFMRLLYGNMVGAGSVSAKNLVNADTDIDSYPNVKLKFAGGSGKQKFGIGVGSDYTAVANADNDLAWVSGLTYNNVVVGTPSVVGTTVKLDITREISNGSGSTKALYEAGLICGAEDNTDENILIARDLVAIILLTGEKSTWTYSITVDFESTTGGFVKNFLDSFIIDWSRVLSDGHSQWSKRSGHQCLVFDSKMWIIGGDATSTRFNDVYSSPDGITWTTVLSNGHAQWSRRRYHQCLVFDSKMWIIGGQDGSTIFNDVYSSADGITWTTVLSDGHAQWSRRRQHQCLVFDSKMWIIGGVGSQTFNDVYSSADGITWTTVLSDGHSQWSGKAGHQCLVFDSKMWIIGGNYTSTIFNDVYSSADGITWTTVLSDGHSQWSRRYGHQCLVFDSKMWIIGGYNYAQTFNDVYSSADGITWTTVLSDGHSQWSRRYGHQCLVFDSKMWIIGGNYTSTYFNDVYSSADGITWTTVLSDGHSQWSRRYGHQCLVFDSKMWIIGGNYTSTYFNDVWNNRKQLESISTDDTLGIIVGTSDTAFSSTDTALTAKISHGTASGELEYGTFPDSMYTVEPATNGSKTTMTLSRRFENSSGGSVTIKEVGIMSVNGLLCRIIPATPIVIENGASEVISIVFETEA